MKSINKGKNIDWATAEALAFSSLIEEGHFVRLSGQDVERGTFSHRHAVLSDQKTNKKFIPISQVLNKDNKHKFTVVNSLLSEYGVLGFEFGVSIKNP